MGEISTVALLDTGATDNVLSGDFYHKLQDNGKKFVGNLGLKIDSREEEVTFPFSTRFVVPLEIIGHLGERAVSMIGDLTKVESANLMKEFPDVLTSKIGCTDIMTHSIELNNLTPVRSKPYYYAPPKLQILKDHIKFLEEKSKIRRSSSPYASPCFLISKENKEGQLVIDYRKLNRKIRYEATPMPTIEMALQFLAGASVYTIVHLNTAYYQIPLSEETRPLTAFISQVGLYEFNVLPFGLATGAQILTWLLNTIFGDIQHVFLLNYLDDLVVYSKNRQEHVEHVREVLTRLRKARLTVNPEKIRFAVSEIDFWGHRISSKGLSISPERTRAIREFPLPKTGRKLSQFLGMVGFYGRIIPNLSSKAGVLYKLKKTGNPLRWSETDKEAFHNLQEDLVAPLVLKMADFEQGFILQTDATSIGLGAVLAQRERQEACGR
uniref:RNA-directed DNA polymerase n=1 Tax=Timema monikensis TaxID=170555 RepID=A0A7R9HJS9_9NEOP|nr:unnamed protein product [Timema monikensis]